MKIALLIASIALVALCHAEAQPLSDDATRLLLAELTEQARSRGGMRADFSEARTSPMLQNPIESSGSLVFSPPAQFRRTVKSRPTSETVCNGETLWIYYPDFNEVEVYSLERGPAALKSLSTLLAAIAFHDMEKNFDVTATQSDNSIRLELRPRSRAAKRVISVASITLNAKREIQTAEWTGVDGDQTRIQLSNVRAASNSERDFEFDPPDSARVVQPFGK